MFTLCANEDTRSGGCGSGIQRVGVLQVCARRIREENKTKESEREYKWQTENSPNRNVLVSSSSVCTYLVSSDREQSTRDMPRVEEEESQWGWVGVEEEAGGWADGWMGTAGEDANAEHR